MKPIRVVIADDEPLARENMCDLLAAHPEVIVVGEAGTVGETIKVLIEARPDAVFLDIQMPGGTGFDVLSGLSQPLQVVFVTAYDKFAIRAFQVNAIDYLLKPIDRKLLAAAVKRLSAIHSIAFDARFDGNAQHILFRMEDDILVSEKGRYFFIPLKTLCAIRAYRNYTEVTNALNQTYLFRRCIKDWCINLPFPPFLQLDRSLVINVEKVSGWHLQGRLIEVVFQNLNVKICLGRAASERFKKAISNHIHIPKGNHPCEGRFDKI